MKNKKKRNNTIIFDEEVNKENDKKEIVIKPCIQEITDRITKITIRLQLKLSLNQTQLLDHYFII